MKPTDDLFQLIKSLTKSEKRYFKVEANLQKGDKRYLQLFERIEAMEFYDEDQLRLHISTTQLSVLKNYLANLILKSLRHFYEGKTVNDRLNRLITEAELLEQKGFYKWCLKKLHSAKKIALRYEKHHELLKILNKEILLGLGRNTKKMMDRMEQLYLEMAYCSEQLRIETDYRRLLHELFVCYRTENKVRDEANFDRIKAFEEHQLLIDASQANTFYAKIYYFFCHALINHLLNVDSIKANNYYKKIVELWDRYPFQKAENTNLYKIHLSNYLNSCHSIARYSEFPNLLERIKKIDSKSFDEAAESFQNITYLELLYHMNTGQYQEAKAIVGNIEVGIEKYRSKINKAREIAFYYNISILFFALEEHDVVLDWTNKIMRDRSIEHRKDMQRFARVIQLIVHYELKNYRMLEYLFNSTYRGLRNRNKLHDFEKAVLQAIKKFMLTTTSKEDKAILTNLQAEILALQDDQLRQYTPGSQEVLVWIKSKLFNKPFIESIKG